jgi:hypothetical protein
MTAQTVVWIKETSPGTWRVAFNGSIMGDSRGYPRERCVEEARGWVQREAGWAARDGRPTMMRGSLRARLDP